MSRLGALLRVRRLQRVQLWVLLSTRSGSCCNRIGICNASYPIIIGPCNIICYSYTGYM